MCGPIAALVHQKKGLLHYHLGRLLSYSISGALIGQFGKLFLQTQITALRPILSVSFFLFLLATGILLFLNFKISISATLRLSAWVKNKFNRFSKWIAQKTLQQSPFVIGLLSFALPCSWLWTFLVLAATTQSPILGAYTLFLFWLGGIPALNALPFVSKRLLKNSTLQQKKVAGIVLILAAIYSLLSFFNL